LRRAIRQLVRPLALSAALVLGTAATSCTTLPDSRSPAQDLDWVRDDANPVALSVRMSEFANRFASRIGRTADRIAAETDSPDGPPCSGRPTRPPWGPRPPCASTPWRR
jgi:hypothetical protein